jgi:hypothetical protein
MQQAQAASMAMPIGEYDMLVVACTSVSSKTGKPMYKTKLQVESGPHQGRTITNNFTLSVENPVALRIFFRQMACFGLDANFFSQNPAPEQVATMLVGRRARITLGVRKWQGEDQNEISQMNPALGSGPTMPGMPAGVGVAPAGVPQMPVAPIPVPSPQADLAAAISTAPAVPTPAPPSPIPSIPTPVAPAAAPVAEPAVQWVIDPATGQPVQVPVAAPAPAPVAAPVAPPVMQWIIGPDGQPVQVPVDGAAAVATPPSVAAPVPDLTVQQPAPVPQPVGATPTAPPAIPY